MNFNHAQYNRSKDLFLPPIRRNMALAMLRVAAFRQPNLMKLFIALFLSIIFAASVKPAYGQQYATKDDIAIILKEIHALREDMMREMKTLREDMIRDMQILREDMNKRFEQVDKRFEQVDKRFEFIQILLVALFAASIGSPFLSRWLDKRKENTISELERLLIALKEYARQDEKMKEIFRNAKLL